MTPVDIQTGDMFASTGMKYLYVIIERYGDEPLKAWRVFNISENRLEAISEELLTYVARRVS